MNLAQTIGGINLALCDGGANGCIKGNDMRVLYYNDDGRRVSIGIAGDHQLTGARLCTAVSVVETNQGFVKLIWHQCAEVKSQTNSIISNFQVRSHGTLVNGVNIAHGGKQMISTPNGTMIPIIYKGGLPYIQHYYPTDKQMREITREEIMTSPGEWNPSLLDDKPDATQKRLRQFPPIPIEQTEAFYNLEGQIIVQRSDMDIDDTSIASDNSSTSSGSRRRSYRSRTRKETPRVKT